LKWSRAGEGGEKQAVKGRWRRRATRDRSIRSVARCHQKEKRDQQKEEKKQREKQGGKVVERRGGGRGDESKSKQK